MHQEKLSESWKLNIPTPRCADPASPDVEEVTVIDEESETRIKSPWKVILFNDDVHSFDEVITQLQKATGCSLPDAEQIALEAHFKGKAMAYSGTFKACFKVMGILREIQLIVEIEG